MTPVYAPQNSLLCKLNRRFVRFEAQRKLPVNLDRPLVSFSFDDCPKSVMNSALKPLEAEGWHSTLYVATGLCDTTNHLGLHMSYDDIKAAHKSGHEIGDHTYSHCDALEHTVDDVLEDIKRNQAVLSNLDIPPSETFAYPYGQVTRKLKLALDQTFKGARGIRSVTHDRSVDLNQIGSHRLYHGADFDRLLSRVADLKDHPGWMTIFTHDVRDNPSEFGCTPSQMKTVIQAVKDSGANVMTVAKAIAHLETAA